MKQLTIIVPAYNVEIYLAKCLSSLIVEEVMEELEVLIIDDGSTDNTLQIANSFEENYPSLFKVIHKKNGGHGSVINYGVPFASGRYFKVLDADDWVVHLFDVISQIKETSADVLIAGYETFHMKSGRRIGFSTECDLCSKDISLEEMMTVFDEIAPCCSFHGIIYKTQPYLAHNIQLTEHIYYEDQEFSCFPFSYIEVVRILPCYFYQYLIGNENQSVSFQNQVKRIHHIEQVCRNMMEAMEFLSLTETQKEFFLRKLAVVAVSYFAVALVKNPNKKQGRTQSELFENYVKKHCPLLWNRIQRKVKILKILNYTRFSHEFYQDILDSKCYKKIKKIWTR